MQSKHIQYTLVIWIRQDFSEQFFFPPRPRLRFNFYIFDNMFSLTYGASPAVLLLLLLLFSQSSSTVPTDSCSLAPQFDEAYDNHMIILGQT